MAKTPDRDKDDVKKGGLRGKLLIERSETPGNLHETWALADDLQEVFADGIGQTLVGPNVAKLALFTIVDIDSGQTEGREIRQLKMRIVLPTTALFEFCSKVISAGQSNDQVIAGRQRDTTKLVGYLRRTAKEPDTEKKEKEKE